MRRRPTRKNRTRFKPNTRNATHNENQKWFKAHPDRKFRIHPKRYDELGVGFLIFKKLTPGYRQCVSIGPEGAMFANTDEMLGQVYDIFQSGKAGVTFPHDGSVIGEDELES